MNILITGSHGFIGRHLVNQLFQQGNTIIAVDNLSTGSKDALKNIPHHFEQVDITDQEKLYLVFKKYQPEYVYHLAALARIQRSWDKPRETYNVNVTGTANVLENCRQFNVAKTFITGSSSVFAGLSLNREPEPIKFYDPLEPLNPYAWQKKLDEELVAYYRQCWNMDIKLGRPFNVFGEGQNYDSDYSTVIPKFAQYKKEGKTLPIYGDGSQMRDFTYVGDIVDMMIAVMQKDKEDWMFNLCAGQPTMILDIAKAFGSHYELQENPRQGEASWTWGDNNTGIKPKVNIIDWIKKI